MNDLESIAIHEFAHVLGINSGTNDLLKFNFHVTY